MRLLTSAYEKNLTVGHSLVLSGFAEKENKKMKKVLAALLSSIAIIALCIGMTACSTTFTGTWKLSKMTISAGGVTQVIEVGKEYNGMIIAADAIILEIKDDNTYTLKGQMSGAMGGEQNGTWEETEGKYYFVQGTEKAEVKMEGTTLVLEETEGIGSSAVSVRVEFKK